MRYVVYGAGAVGGGIGGLLALAGVPVVVVARGAHLEALRARGLEIRSPGGVRQVPVTAVAADELELEAGDVVITAVKSQDTSAVLDAVAARRRDVAVVCAQNGVDNERQAARRFARVYGMCILMPASHLEPGVVILTEHPVPGVLDVGRYPSGIDATVEEVTVDLRAAGFDSQPHAAIMRRKYRKLLTNLTNVLDAAGGPAGRRTPLARRAQEEAAACLVAAGIEVGPQDEELARRAMLDHADQPTGNDASPSSSWQSLARGRPSIETDYLNGEIVLLGRLHGVATPVNSLLCRLGDRLLRDSVAPGSLPLDRLEAFAAGGPP